MRCFCCDKDLPDTVPPDSKTDKWYCFECFAPTMEYQLARAAKEIQWELMPEAPLQAEIPLEEQSLEDIETYLKEAIQAHKEEYVDSYGEEFDDDSDW